MCDKCSHDEHEQLKFVCECGKELETQIKLSHHKTRCKVFQTNKKRREFEDKESRRLPNGMFKCENPKCGKEHDGNYGSGRFCSRHCRDQFNGITSAKTSIKNGTKHAPENFKAKPAPYGTWKCSQCEFIAKTRKELFEHKCLTNHKSSCKGRPLPQWHKDKIRNSLIGKPGHKFTIEQKQHAREAALNRTIPLSTKRTEDYICKDGSIVRLDSSYERKVAKLLDDNNIKWIRPEPLDWYSLNGIKHHYYPDFYLVEYDVYLDPKNDYCFKVQTEKIQYILKHYNNCFFLHKDELNINIILKILEQYRSGHTGAAC